MLHTHIYDVWRTEHARTDGDKFKYGCDMQMPAEFHRLSVVDNEYVFVSR
jgi:hypothetical protein